MGEESSQSSVVYGDTSVHSIVYNDVADRSADRGVDDIGADPRNSITRENSSITRDYTGTDYSHEESTFHKRSIRSSEIYTSIEYPQNETTFRKKSDGRLEEYTSPDYPVSENHNNLADEEYTSPPDEEVNSSFQQQHIGHINSNVMPCVSKSLPASRRQTYTCKSPFIVNLGYRSAAPNKQESEGGSARFTDLASEQPQIW